MANCFILSQRTFHHCHRNFNLGQRLGVVTSGLHCEIAFSARRITYTLPLFLLDSSPSLSAAAPTFAMYPVFESAFFKVSRLITQSPLLSDTLVNDTSRQRIKTCMYVHRLISSCTCKTHMCRCMYVRMYNFVSPGDKLFSRVSFRFLIVERRQTSQYLPFCLYLETSLLHICLCEFIAQREDVCAPYFSCS